MVSRFIQRALPVWSVLVIVLIGLAAVSLAGFVLYHAMVIVTMLALAVVVAMLLNPLVRRLSRKIPRGAAIVLIYLCLIGFIAILGVLIVPALVDQGQKFSQEQLPTLKVEAQNLISRYTDWYKFQSTGTVHELISRALEKGKEISSQVLESLVNSVLGIASWTARGVIILVMSIYLLLDQDHYVDWFHKVAPTREQERLQELYIDLVGVLGAYLRGLAMMVLFVAFAVSLLLLITHNKYWLFIGTMAGMLEVIPYFGAVAGAIPAVTMGFMQSPQLGIELIVAFIVINQVEGHVVAPLVMGHSMHMRPLAVLLSLLVGAEVKGVVGMIVAVPIVGMLRVLWEHLRPYFKQQRPAEPLSLNGIAAAQDPLTDPQLVV